MTISDVTGQYTFNIVFINMVFAWIFIMITWQLTDKRRERYQELVRQIKYLTKTKNSIVTLADLVFETKYSPKECQKILNKIAVQLDADVNYTESGKLYYKFPIADNLGLQQKEKYEKLIRYAESCANYNNGIITVVDLSFKAELSPTECKEFLDNFITEVKGEVEITKQGHFYYKLPTAKNIKLKKLQGDK